jgi:chaperonin GroES
MKLKPIDDRVIVQKVEEETRTAGGIIIPDTAKEEPQQGKVIAVSETDDNEDIKVGDIVIYAKYGPTEIKLGNEEYLIVSRSDILAVVEK